MLPDERSRYNVGRVNGHQITGRYKEESGKNRFFALGREVAVRDGSGRKLARVRSESVRLNRGVQKSMDVNGDGEADLYVWGWDMETDQRDLSGWIPYSALKHPPRLDPPPDVNPRPPGEGSPLKIDCEEAGRALADLRFKNRKGVIPDNGNWGDHYSGRYEAPLNFINLCFNVPNVVGGGVAKDSIPDGALFVPGLDEEGRPIRERMTMYRHGDLEQDVPVHFVYGRPQGELFRKPRGTLLWGWIAQANVGHIPTPGER